MSRLTERQTAGYDLIEMKGAWCDSYCREQSEVTCRDCAIWKGIQKLARYEDLEEQGRLVKLPCKVGTPVYYIGTNIDSKIFKQKYFIGEYYFRLEDIYEFGKKIFLTREEAEAKMEELNEKILGYTRN